MRIFDKAYRRKLAEAGPDRHIELVLALAISFFAAGQWITSCNNNASSGYQADQLIAASKYNAYAAEKNVQAARDFAESARGINSGVGDAVSRLGNQAEATQSLASAALLQAQAARSSADTAKQGLHIGEGPVLTAPASGELRLTTIANFPTINYPQAILSYSNIGKTPAISVVVTTFVDISGGSELPPVPAYDGLSGETVAAGAGKTKAVSTRDRKHVELSQLYDLKNDRMDYAGFSIAGYLQYKDLFGDQHITAFCNFYPYQPSESSTSHQCAGLSNWFEHPPIFKKADKQ